MNQTVQCFSRSMPGLLEGKSILITDDRMTPDLGDYYVVKPVFEFWKRTAHELNAAKPVPGELSHTSERNSECLDGDDLSGLDQRHCLSPGDDT